MRWPWQKQKKPLGKFDYTRADIERLARIIEPEAWARLDRAGVDMYKVPFSSEWFKTLDRSTKYAARVLMARYREQT